MANTIIQFINYTLSFFMWMIMGRVVFAHLFGEKETAIYGIFKKVTDPVYTVTRKIVPRAGEKWMPALAILLLVVIRLALIFILSPV